MKRIGSGVLVAALLGCLLIAVGSRPARACSCIGFSDTEALAAADAAFLGTVASVNKPQQPSSSLDPVTWTFTVEGVFKGDVASRQDVVSAFSSASCGIELDLGARYLVFARSGGRSDPRPRPGQLAANLCGGTRSAERNETPGGFPQLRSVQGTTPTHRMVPSDRTVRPGQVVTVTVRGPGADQWIGGVDSYFERRRGDGSWQRMHMLVWYGDGEPTIADPNGAIDDLGVRASPFKVRIPPVEPGTYRITRTFRTGPSPEPVETLSTRVTVTK